MNDLVFAVAVLVVTIGGLAGVAHLLDKRHKASGGKTIIPEIGPVGRILLWAIRILVVVMVLSVIGTFVFGIPALIWLAAGCLVVYIVIARIYQVVRFTGK